MRRLVSIIAVFALLLICPGMGGIGHVLAAGTGDIAAEAARDAGGSIPCHGQQSADQDHDASHGTDAPSHKGQTPCGDMSACGAHHWLQSPPSIVPVLTTGLAELILPAFRPASSAASAPDPHPPKRLSIA